jgi:hypothetical protein
MEYLTLQDIPHRQYEPLHSHRMAPSQPTERPLGSMAAAVSRTPSPDPRPRGPPTLSFSYLPAPRVVASRQERDSEPFSSSRSRPCNCSDCRPLPPAESLPELRERHPVFGQHFTSAAHAITNRRARNSSTSIEDELCDIFLTNTQNAQMRSSPPIQPNEHGYADKLPSFSEVHFCSSETMRWPY